MTILFIEYPKCSTCQRAKKWLLDHHIDFEDRHIVEENPSINELKEWLPISHKPIKSFFNTSGLLYKSMDLKNRLPTMSEDESISLLASNGMLVKRPLIIGDDYVLIGFKEAEWLATLVK
ncbi:MAG: arsenate reductase family protein [Acetobacter sp.]|nr:arsenate reductase family protein [Acetobacter sp.]MCM1441342.1 arsenate reductase family protein [Roseburia sp.]